MRQPREKQSNSFKREKRNYHRLLLLLLLLLLPLLKKMWMRKEAKVGKMIVASIMMSYDLRPSLNVDLEDLTVLLKCFITN